MVTDTGLIVMSLISLAGMVLIFTLNNSTWFKKENFKIQKKVLMDENRIKMKRLERELGLKNAAPVEYTEPRNTLDVAGDILPILKNLDGEQIKGLAGIFLGNDDERDYDAPEPDLTSMLVDYATKNPEVVQGLLNGITKPKTEAKDIYE